MGGSEAGGQVMANEVTTASLLLRYERKCATTFECDMESRRVRPRTAHALRDTAVSARVGSGDEVMRALNAALDTWAQYQYKRSVAQKQLHSAFCAALAPHIYGDQYEANAERLAAEWGWENPKLHVMAICPRRFGKTVAVSMFVAACLATVPHCNVVVFSTNQRCSNMLLALVQKFYCWLPQSATLRLVESNKSTIAVATAVAGADAATSNGDVRRVTGFPGGSKVRVPRPARPHAAWKFVATVPHPHVARARPPATRARHACLRPPRSSPRRRLLLFAL